jgi:hypothetical protein
MVKGRGQRPPVPTGKVPESPAPVSTDNETPKFCLHYLARDFDVSALTTAQQAALAKTLQKLSGFRWRELIMGPRHSHGMEHMPISQIRVSLPPKFQDRDKVTVFRYDGNLPMAGVRVRDVFHLLWIEPSFGKLYDHGS